MGDTKSTGIPASKDDLEPPPLGPDQQELSRILKSLRHDPTLMGVISLGIDGVLRSLTADRDVVDAVAFSPRLIKAMLDRFPFDQTTEDKYRGVDGTMVPKEQWFHPDKDMLPPPMSAEKKEETKKRIEANREAIDKARSTPSTCTPVVRSDHNLEPKI